MKKKSLTVLDSMTGRDISCLWNCYSLSAQREFIEALQEFSKNFQRSNESDWSMPGGYKYMFQGFTVIDDYLQTFIEFKAVQNSFNFVQGICLCMPGLAMKILLEEHCKKFLCK